MSHSFGVVNQEGEEARCILHKQADTFILLLEKDIKEAD